MEDKNTNWTSIDAYYKGFHVKKTYPKAVGREKLITLIEQLIDAGFEPSWNKETSDGQLDKDPIMEATKDQGVTCPIHKVVMKRYEKDGQSWHSHMVSEGVWCNGKAK